MLKEIIGFGIDRLMARKHLGAASTPQRGNESLAQNENQDRSEAGQPPHLETDGLDAKHSQEVTFRDVSLAIEFICWIIVALAPMLRLVNGAPVTDDQAYIQIGIVVLAVCGAVGLRIYNWRVPLPDNSIDSVDDSG